MSSDVLDERARLAIELALTASRTDKALHDRQEADARRLGMVGAEIDAARSGRSFDARTSRAIALATAAECDRAERLAGALRAGFGENDCVAIEAFAAQVTSGAIERTA